MPIAFDNDNIKQVTIDGEPITELTIDGENVKFEREVAAPGNPSWSSQVNTVTATVPVVTGATHYRVNNGSWQTSRTFSGLSPATNHKFQARIPETRLYLETISNERSSTSPKADQSVSAPASVSWSSQINTVTGTAAAVSGATHYRVNNGTWQTSRTFAGLNPVTNYNFQARKEATSSLNEAISGNRNSTSPRANRSAPSRPSASNIQHDRVTITGANGTQVRQGSGTWYSSPRTFTGLNEQTSYSFYARFPQTTTHNASAQSSARTITTPQYMPAPGGSLSSYSWNDINLIAESGNASSYFEIGDEIIIPIGGHDFIVFQIYGFNHDDKVTGGKAGITFGPKRQLPASGSRMNSSGGNSGGWEECDMRTWANGTFYNMLPSGVRNVIKQVNKPTADGAETSASIINSQDRCFLFSGREVGLGVHTLLSEGGEGTKYPIFTDDISRRKPYFRGGNENLNWALRSPCRQGLPGRWRRVLSNGASGSFRGDDYIKWSVVGFCV